MLTEAALRARSAYLQRQREQARPERIPATVEMMARDFEGKEFGSNGEMSAPRPPEEPAPQPQALEIPPPPWAGKEAEQLIGQLDDHPPDKISALDAMKAADDGFDPPPPPGPMPVTPPLVRPRPPEPDWRAIEAEHGPGAIVFHEIEPEP